MEKKNLTLKLNKGNFLHYEFGRLAMFVSQIFKNRFNILVCILGLLLLNSTNSFAERTVKGIITDKNGNPAANVRVKAFDDDAWPNPDDLMGQTMTDSAGYYEIHYEGKHWDTAAHWWTIWRPDIFIRVSARVEGWCDGGQWEASQNWVHLKDSGVNENHRLRDDLTINLTLGNYPLNVPLHQTFVRGVDMWSKVVFFFYTKCFACASNGDKVAWVEWGFGGAPKVRTRCWFPPKSKCTDADYEAIEELGRAPFPVEVDKPLQ